MIPLGRAVVATVVLAALATVSPGDPSGGQEDGAARVTFDALNHSTWVLEEGPWAIDLVVSGAPRGSSATARIYPRVRTRAAYDASLFNVFPDDERVTLPTIELDDALTVPSGGRRLRYGIVLREAEPAAPTDLRLSRGLAPGVYPVQIEVRDADGEPAGSMVTHITRVAGPGEGPSDAVPMQVAPVLGLETALPSTTPDGTADLNPRTVIAANDLADLLEGAPGLPLTLAPSPEALEALARDETGRAQVERIGANLEGRQLLDRPYVDIPFASWIVRDMDTEILRQRQRGSDVLRRLLAPPDSSTWLATSPLTGEAGGALWGVGVRTVVLPTSALASPGDDPTTLTHPVEIPTTDPSATLRAVVADEGLAYALTRRRDPELDIAGLAAELALIADDEPTDPRGVAIAPRADAALDGDVLGALAFLLLAPGSPVEPTTIADLSTHGPGGNGQALAPRPLPPLGTYPDDLARVRNRLSSFGSLVGRDDAEVKALGDLLLLSAGQSLNPEQRLGYVAEVDTVVEARLDGVQAAPRQTITLTSSRGQLPLTVRSSLRRPVDVTVTLDAGSRLEFPDGPQFSLRLQPGTNRVDIPVRARVPGDSPITISIDSPDGAANLVSARYTVRSTAVSGIGVVLSIGAILFLLLWWGRHVVRDRRRRATRATAT